LRTHDARHLIRDRANRGALLSGSCRADGWSRDPRRGRAGLPAVPSPMPAPRLPARGSTFLAGNDTSSPRCPRGEAGVLVKLRRSFGPHYRHHPRFRQSQCRPNAAGSLRISEPSRANSVEHWHGRPSSGRTSGPSAFHAHERIHPTRRQRSTCWMASSTVQVRSTSSSDLPSASQRSTRFWAERTVVWLRRPK